MEAFQRKEFITGRSLKYTYYVSPSGRSTEQCPALLFVHGFPDSAHLWKDVIRELGDKVPSQIIVPDCLGYAGTDKPTDTGLYSFHGQAADIVGILKHENVQSAVLIGHDWGSALAQRIYLHHRALFSALILLNTGYMVPSDQPFDLAAVNDATTKAFGYPQFSYWDFFTAPDASEIINARLERMWQVLHGGVEDWMKKLFCVPNAMREFLLNSEQEVPLKPYAQKAEWRDAFLAQFRRDGFGPSLQMYRATATNVQSQSDSRLLMESLVIDVPLLFVICSRDAVCLPQLMDAAKQQGLVPKLEEVVLDAAHWSPMEKPAEIASYIHDFLANSIKLGAERPGRP